MFRFVMAVIGEKVVQNVIALMAFADDRAAYKRKFDAGSLEREPPEFWHGYRARIAGRSLADCPYRDRKRDTWRRGFDAP